MQNIPDGPLPIEKLRFPLCSQWSDWPRYQRPRLLHPLQHQYIYSRQSLCSLSSPRSNLSHLQKASKQIPVSYNTSEAQLIVEVIMEECDVERWRFHERTLETKMDSILMEKLFARQKCKYYNRMRGHSKHRAEF